MSWGKAIPVLVLCIIFDALRFMFEMFWFFGPALVAVFCTIKVGEVVGTTIGGLACGATAGTVGFFGFGVLETFGVVMAMVTGLAGWLVIGLILVMFNGRIFKENALWFAGSLLISEVPIVGAVPAITIVVWKMYGTQIRIEKAEMARWKKEQAAARLQERNLQMAQLMQAQAAQQEAANNEQYTQKLDNAA